MPAIEIVTLLLVHISFLLSIALVFLVSRKSRRSPIRTAFYANFFTMIVWNLGTMLELDFRLITGATVESTVSVLLIDLCYLAICFMPITILYMGKIIYQPYWKPSAKHLLLLIVPTLSFLMVCTNPLHHLFFRHFSLHSAEAVYGSYYYFHSVYSYACILVGMGYMAAFTFRSTGIFSRQSILVLTGVLVPLVGNLLFSFGIVDLTFSVNACLFTVSIVILAIAFFKYRFTTVVPIAVRQVIDLISDGYLVADAEMNIVDYNQALTRLLPAVAPVTPEMTLQTFFNRCGFNRAADECLSLYEQAEAKGVSMAAEVSVADPRYFTMTITPIFHRNEYTGSITLIKDMTEVKLAIETIQRNQAVLMDQERLASLGQLAGGIAHNLKTPILSIAGGMEALRDLVAEYGDSVGDVSITAEDHREIVEEMLGWIGKVEKHCDYISDMITSIKGQAAQMNSSEGEYFSIGDFFKQVEILMKHELKKSHCELILDAGVDEATTFVDGDINSLVQVFDNLIMNALYAYNEQEGKIIVRVWKEKERYIFTVTDYGCGIPENVRLKLFREMVTTKGKRGSGLGLYMSYSTITGKFGGTMTVESSMGEGTVFTIALPAPQTGLAAIN